MTGAAKQSSSEFTNSPGYTTREVAELVGLNTDQVRHYVRRKLLQPDRGERGEFRFCFQDVVLLRTAKGLMDASVSTRKAYRALVKLKGDLAQVKSLSSVRIYADGNSVVVRDDEHTWEVETGQTTIDFSSTALTEPDLEDNVAELTQRHVTLVPASDEMDTDEWYNLGLDLEEVEPEKAPDAYKHSIRLDPKNADAHVNLGSVVSTQW